MKCYACQKEILTRPYIVVTEGHEHTRSVGVDCYWRIQSCGKLGFTPPGRETLFMPGAFSEGTK